MAGIDRIGLWWLDLGIAVAIWSTAVMMAMVAIRQPVRRRELARVGLLGSILLLPLALMPLARIPWSSVLPAPLTPIGRSEPLRCLFRLLEACPARYPLLAYLGGVGLGLAWLGLGAWALRRLVRTASEPSEPSRQLFQSLITNSARADRAALDVKVSPRVGRPVLVGLRDRTILLPPRWDLPQPEAQERLRLGLLHELAHAEERDGLFHWIAGVANALWFVWPPVWWIRRQLRIDQEFLADERASRRFGASASSYASSLVAMAAGTEASVAAGVPFDGMRAEVFRTDGSPLVQRIAMLVHCPFPVESRPPTGWRRGLFAVAGLLLALLSRFTVVEPSTPTSAAVLKPPPATSGRVTIPALEFEPREGASDRFRLPIRLTPRFELNLELHLPLDALDQVEIAGYRLRSPNREPGRLADGGAPRLAWQDVRLVVGDGDAQLWINGRPARPRKVFTDPEGRLTIRAPGGGPIALRNLDFTGWLDAVAGPPTFPEPETAPDPANAPTRP